MFNLSVILSGVGPLVIGSKRTKSGKTAMSMILDHKL